MEEGKRSERLQLPSTGRRERERKKNDACINGDTHVYLRVAAATLRLSSCAMMDVYHVRQRSSHSTLRFPSYALRRAVAPRLYIRSSP